MNEKNEFMNAMKNEMNALVKKYEDKFKEQTVEVSELKTDLENLKEDLKEFKEVSDKYFAFLNQSIERTLMNIEKIPEEKDETPKKCNFPTCKNYGDGSLDEFCNSCDNYAYKQADDKKREQNKKDIKQWVEERKEDDENTRIEKLMTQLEEYLPKEMIDTELIKKYLLK